MLVHMAPSEVNALQTVAKAHGGSLTTNPDTGLPEAGFLSSILPMVAGVGLTALSGGALSPMMAGLITGGVTGAATGSLKKGLMAGLGAYGGAGIGGALSGAGATAANTAASNAILNANPGLTAGEIGREMGAAGFVKPQLAANMDPVQMSKMSMTDKLTAGVKGLGGEAGRDAFMQNIGGTKGLMRYGAAALSPLMLAQSGEAALRPADLPNRFEFDAGATGAIQRPGAGEVSYFRPRLRQLAEGGSTGMTGESDEYYRYLMGLAPMPAAYVAPVATPVNLSSPDSAALSPPAQMLAASRRLPYHGELGPADPNDGVTPISNMTADQQAEFYAANPTLAAITQALQGLFGMTALGALQKSMVPDFVASRAQAAQGLKPSNYGYNEGLGYYSLGNPNVDQIVAASDTPGIFSAPVGGIGLHATPAGGITGGLGLNPSNTGVGLTTAGANLAKSGYSLTAGPSSGPTGPTGADEDDAAMGAAIANAIEAQNNAAVTQADLDDAASGVAADVNAANEAGIAAGIDPGEFARGGLSSLAAFAQGGYNLGDYSDGGRLLRGPGDGVSDSIPASIGNKRPARLADGEFVVPARIVSELGNGSTEAGARKLYAMMDRVQKNRRKSIGRNKVAVNSRSDKYLPA
jgi:hypothetical protein